MLRFDGEKPLAVAATTVWTRLTDVPFLLTCLPDLDTVESVSADEAKFVLRPALVFVRGTLNAHLTVLERTPETSVRFKLDARGIGSTSTVEVTLTLEPQGTGTLLRYVAEVTQLGGLLKLVPSGLIQGAARKVVTDVLNSVEKKLAT